MNFHNDGILITLYYFIIYCESNSVELLIKFVLFIINVNSEELVSPKTNEICYVLYFTDIIYEYFIF